MVSGSRRPLVIASRCSALLSWRLPPRSRRCRCVCPEEAGIGAEPAVRATLASVAKRPAPAISPISLAAVSAPQPRSARNRGARAAVRAGELALEVVDRARQLADAAQFVARDPDAGALLGGPGTRRRSCVGLGGPLHLPTR